MPLYTIRVTYENGTSASAFFRLRNLSDFMKKHPLHGQRSVVPVLPWLIDLAWDKVNDDRVDSTVQRIDIEESAV